MGDLVRRGFWSRRLAHDEWLGRHATLGVLMCLLLLCLFLLLAAAVGGPQPPTLEQRIGDKLREHREASPRTCAFFRTVTEMGDAAVLAPLILGTSALLFWRRRWAISPALILIILTGAELNTRVKGIYDRPRPAIHDIYIHESS